MSVGVHRPLQLSLMLSLDNEPLVYVDRHLRLEFES